LKTFSL